jgi:hypothetical protein
MGDRRSSTAGALGAVVALLACISLVSAEGSQLIATVERPAVVTAAPAPGPESTPGDQRVVVSVMAFTPPSDGTVQGVVKVQKSEGGPEQEIGRFGMFPNAEFRATDPSQAQRFSFSLPRDVARGAPVKVTVQIVPQRGEGKDARLEIGGAEIR